MDRGFEQEGAEIAEGCGRKEVCVAGTQFSNFPFFRAGHRKNMKTSRLITVLLVAWFTGWAGASERERALLLGGVTELDFGKSVPGVLDVSEPGFPVLVDGNGKAMGAASMGAGGRVVVFSHGVFVTGAALENPSGQRLMLNAVRWAGKGSQVRVGFAPGLEGSAALIQAAGLETRIIGPAEVSVDVVDVYVAKGQEVAAEGDLAALEAFRKAGGGLVAAATPWAFAKKYPDFETEFPGNRLIAGSGILYSRQGTAKTDGPLAIATMMPEVAPVCPDPPVGMRAAPGPLAAAKSILDGGNTMPKEEREAAIREMQSGGELTGAEAAAFWEALRELDEKFGPVVPTNAEPLGLGEDPLRDAIVILQDQLAMSLPAAELQPIAAAKEYPGAVPATAQRVTETIVIAAPPRNGIGGDRTNYLVSTGFYAPAGEVVKIMLPGEAVEAGFAVRVGAYHISLLERKDTWQRYPNLKRDYKVEGRVTEVANALGGIITIQVPRRFDEDRVEVGIEGAVRAPFYEHGVTSVADWKSKIRDYPAPWAELASSRVVLTLPSEYVRKLDDPDVLMELWDEILDGAADLLAIDRDEIRPERIVCERQLALGSMHSGYPIGTHTGKFPEIALDAKRLRAEGDWGIFHEIGHNHQRPMWYLPGTTETTCNLWSLYLYETVIGKGSEETHRAVQPLNRRQTFMEYMNGGKNFEKDWNVWTALETYMQLQEAFGWEAFQEVFDEYNKLDPNERPKEQQEKNDEWMVRFSKTVGRNLGPFFRAWNIPVTEKALAEVSGLPEWKEDPMRSYR